MNQEVFRRNAQPHGVLHAGRRGLGNLHQQAFPSLTGPKGIACKSSFRLDQRLHHPVNEMKEAEHLDYRLTREKRIQLNVIEYRLKAVRIFMNMIKCVII